MLSDDIETVDDKLSCKCSDCKESRDAWLRIKTALAELGTTGNSAMDAITALRDEVSSMSREKYLASGGYILSKLRKLSAV